MKQGNKYYDHRLTEIEKTKLIDLVNQPASDFTTAGNASLPPYVGYKDKKLISLLQTNPEEISLAEERMRDIDAERNHRQETCVIWVLIASINRGYKSKNLPFQEFS